MYQIVQEKPKAAAALKNPNDTKRFEKENKRLQLELSKEKENYAHLHKQLNQEIQTLKEDLDKREQEIFKLKSMSSSVGSFGNSLLNLANITASPITHNTVYSIHSSSMGHSDDYSDHDNQDRLESWLSIPNKRNIRRHGWKKFFVVLRKGKLYFYNSLRDKESHEAVITIDLEYFSLFNTLIRIL